MSMTKGAIIAAARERADAVGSSRWDDADLEVLLGVIHWREWAHILNANSTYSMRSETFTTDSSGRISKADLNDSKWQMYRILSLRIGNRYYVPIRYSDAPAPSEVGANSAFGWYEYGAYIQVVPAQAAVECEITYNYRPQRVTSLVSSGTIVGFPDGYEHVLVYGLASEILVKGGAETEASLDMERRANILREDMLSDLRRISVRPTIMQAMDDPSDWGSW